MLSYRWINGCFALCLTVGLIDFAAAADKHPVYTDPAQADADFALQGEFRGWQELASAGGVRSRESVGLQVIAQGEGQFLATKYYGGLPGDGWDGLERYSLKGARIGDRVELTGEQYDIIVTADEGTIQDHRGRTVGQLRRVERTSPTAGLKAPLGATALFTSPEQCLFKNPKVTPEGWLSAGTETLGAWNDFRLHGEFRLPYKPTARGQDRGNSGFYLQGRYEVQVLDSFGLEGVENECGALYRTQRPDINMCLPPLAWQTYDIEFRAPRFDAAGKKVRDMQISVWQNGVPVHSERNIANKTGAGQPEAPHPLPIKLQDHGNPVVYRNIWLVDRSQPLSDTIWPIHYLTPPTPIAPGRFAW